MASKWTTKCKGKKRDEAIKWVSELEYKQNKLPEADLTIYFNVPVKHGQKLLKGKKKDIHEKNIRYLKQVEKVFLKLSEKGRWKMLDCVKDERLLSKKDIHELVWNQAKRILRS